MHGQARRNPVDGHNGGQGLEHTTSTERVAAGLPSPAKRKNGRSSAHHGKLWLDLRKDTILMKLAKPWSRLPREFVESPSLEIRLKFWSKIEPWATCSGFEVGLSGGWTRGYSKVPGNCNTPWFYNGLDLTQLISPLLRIFLKVFKRCLNAGQRAKGHLDQLRKIWTAGGINCQAAGYLGEKWGDKVVRLKSVLERGWRQCGEGAELICRCIYRWCTYLLGSCFRKKSAPKENNEVFMFWLTEALMLFHSVRASSFLRNTSAVPSGYSCFCSKRENGNWEKEKMKCLWQENSVPEAIPLGTERREGRTPSSRIFAGFLPISYFTFNEFISLKILCFRISNRRIAEVRDARGLLDHLLHCSLPAENCSLRYIF